MDSQLYHFFIVVYLDIFGVESHKTVFVVHPVYFFKIIHRTVRLYLSFLRGGFSRLCGPPSCKNLFNICRTGILLLFLARGASGTPLYGF